MCPCLHSMPNSEDLVCIHIICRPILKCNYIATAFSRLLMKTCHKNGLLPQKKWIPRPRLCTYVWPYSKPLPQSVSKVLYVCVRRTDLNGWTLKTNNTIKASSFDLGLVFRILYENFPICDALEWAIFPEIEKWNFSKIEFFRKRIFPLKKEFFQNGFFFK